MIIWWLKESKSLFNQVKTKSEWQSIKLLIQLICDFSLRWLSQPSKLSSYYLPEIIFINLSFINFFISMIHTLRSSYKSFIIFIIIMMSFIFFFIMFITKKKETKWEGLNLSNCPSLSLSLSSSSFGDQLTGNLWQLEFSFLFLSSSFKE